MLHENHVPFQERVRSSRRLLLASVLCAGLTGAFLFVSVPVQAGSSPDLKPVPGRQVVDVTAEPGYQNEPSIAVNPENPAQVVAAYQVKAHAAYSRDGGKTWRIAEGTAPSDYRISGDVSVAFDRQGNAYLCYIAFDKLGTISYWGHNATRNGIFVRRSEDGGKTWGKEPGVVFAHPTEPGIPFEDKPYILVDDTQGPHSGNLYVGWTEFRLTESVMLFSRSRDQGRTWSTPITISTHPGLPRDDNGAVEGFEGAVGADSALYVVWADGQHIVFTRSRDGGRSFEPSRDIIDIAPPYFEVSGVSRANGFPQIGIDPRAGSEGRLYVTWSDYRNGDIDVFCVTSDNGGEDWSKPVRVNSDPIHNGADQFFQWLAVDPVGGDAYVVFYDRRADPGNRKAVVVLARSTDAGRSFKNYSWTEEPFDARGDFLGDYTGLAAQNGRVYGIWAEKRPALQSPPPAKESGGQSKNRSPKGRTQAPEKKRQTIVRIGVADFQNR